MPFVERAANIFEDILIDIMLGVADSVYRAARERLFFSLLETDESRLSGITAASPAEDVFFGITHLLLLERFSGFITLTQEDMFMKPALVANLRSLREEARRRFGLHALGRLEAVLLSRMPLVDTADAVTAAEVLLDFLDEETERARCRLAFAAKCRPSRSAENDARHLLSLSAVLFNCAGREVF